MPTNPAPHTTSSMEEVVWGAGFVGCDDRVGGGWGASDGDGTMVPETMSWVRPPPPVLYLSPPLPPPPVGRAPPPQGATAAGSHRRERAPPRAGAAAGGRRRGGPAGRRWCERRQRAGLPQSTGTERAKFAASPERGARLTVKPPRI